MKIVDKALTELKPYEKNPRSNDEAVDFVKNSIQEFGFKVPLVIDKNDVIVCGHTRYKAAQDLQMKSIPCVIADDLSPDQIKAYRLADNKVAEAALWDEELLNNELFELSDLFDMGEFGFDLSLPDFSSGSDSEDVSDEEREQEGYYGDARERTAEIYRLYEFDPFRSDGKYQMPTLKRCEHIPDRLIGFNYLLTSKDYEAGIHFYLDDYQFERIWNSPHKYIERLSFFDCALTPDFSLYLNMSLAMKIWNTYRSRLIGQMMQDAGIEVIPTLSWAEPETFEFCFDGIEPGGIVSVSTIGVKRDEESKSIWIAGMNEAIKRLKPSHVVVYGGDIGYNFGKVTPVFIANEVNERWKERER